MRTQIDYQDVKGIKNVEIKGEAVPEYSGYTTEFKGVTSMVQIKDDTISIRMIGEGVEGIIKNGN
jgi:hypothetical protein